MGQLSKFMEADAQPPAVALRIVNVVLPLVAVVQACVTRRLEEILLAVFLVGIMLPAGIAPGGSAQVAAGLESRRVLGSVYMFLVFTCGGVAFFSYLLPRQASLLAALGLAALVVMAARVGRRRRTAGSPRPDGRGEPL
ncbi:hypothetical protein [Kribbella sp. NPDC003557]|uniref:hypothetical protein n=1 Tax=Kribbella sp. NPDC003557 TaxID=3154449 RepID=UPI0033AF27B5